MNWLWAWENPHPDKAIVGLRFEPVSGTVVVSGDLGGRCLRASPALAAAPQGAA